MCLQTPPPIVNESNTPHFGMTVLSHIAKLSPLCEPLRFRRWFFLGSTDGGSSPFWRGNGSDVPSRQGSAIVSTVDAREL